MKSPYNRAFFIFLRINTDNFEKLLGRIWGKYKAVTQVTALFCFFFSLYFSDLDFYLGNTSVFHLVIG